MTGIDPNVQSNTRGPAPQTLGELLSGVWVPYFILVGPGVLMLPYGVLATISTFLVRNPYLVSSPVSILFSLLYLFVILAVPLSSLYVAISLRRGTPWAPGAAIVVAIVNVLPWGLIAFCCGTLAGLLLHSFEGTGMYDYAPSVTAIRVVTAVVVIPILWLAIKLIRRLRSSDFQAEYERLAAGVGQPKT